MTKDKVFLVQTDTTVGFLSQSALRLAQIKERDPAKHFVQVTDSFKTLKQISRVPNRHKNRVRRSERTTFAYAKEKAVRVVKDEKHARFVKPYKWFYSTSANERSLAYAKDFAFAISDIIVEDKKGLYEGRSSTIYRLGRFKLQRLR